MKCPGCRNFTKISTSYDVEESIDVELILYRISSDGRTNFPKFVVRAVYEATFVEKVFLNYWKKVLKRSKNIPRISDKLKD